MAYSNNAPASVRETCLQGVPMALCYTFAAGCQAQHSEFQEITDITQTSMSPKGFPQ